MHRSRAAEAGVWGVSHIYTGGEIVAKTGYRVLDNGDIVGLDDQGEPTTQPFTGYVADEHLRVAEEFKAREARKRLPPRVLKRERLPGLGHK